MLDSTDLRILEYLKKDSRSQWKDIGEGVHLTGQAVAARVRRMEDLGVIEGYTVRLNEAKLGQPVTALITMFMKTNDHGAFQRFVAGHPNITEAHRISGDGCYWLRVRGADQEEIGRLLDELLTYGVYRLNLSIGRVK